MNKKITKYILGSFLTSLLLFVVIRPIAAQMDADKLDLLDYLLRQNVEVGEELVDGHTQVYYNYEEDKKFITEGSFNSRQPDTNGEYITYVKDINGEGQIFLYHIPTGKTIQVTKSGPNLNPSVGRNGNTVWEGWVYNTDGSGTWQVFLFNGSIIKQVTQGDTSLSPTISDGYALFTRKNSLGEWRSEVYSEKDDVIKVISFGIQNKDARLVGDNITFTDGGIYPLKPADLFLFDLDAMEQINNIIPEPESLGDSTESAEVNITPSLEPEATSSASNL